MGIWSSSWRWISKFCKHPSPPWLGFPGVFNSQAYLHWASSNSSITAQVLLARHCFLRWFLLESFLVSHDSLYLPVSLILETVVCTMYSPLLWIQELLISLFSLFCLLLDRSADHMQNWRHSLCFLLLFLFLFCFTKTAIGFHCGWSVDSSLVSYGRQNSKTYPPKFLGLVI